MHHREGGTGDAPVGLRRIHPDVEQMQGLGDAGIIGERLLRVQRKRSEQEERKRRGGGAETGRWPEPDVRCLHRRSVPMGHGQVHDVAGRRTRFSRTAGSFFRR